MAQSRIPYSREANLEIEGFCRVCRGSTFFEEKNHFMAAGLHLQLLQKSDGNARLAQKDSQGGRLGPGL